MHRTVRTTVATALLLATAACSSGTGRTAAPPAGTGGTGASATATPGATGTPTTTPATRDDTANTQRVCATVDKLFEGPELDRFAQDLGRMITYKKAGQTARARAARNAAEKDLNKLATAVRRDTGSARDPQLQAAGEQAADDITETAADNAFFARIRTLKDVRQNLTSEMTTWLTPLSLVCA